MPAGSPGGVVHAGEGGHPAGTASCGQAIPLRHLEEVDRDGEAHAIQQTEHDGAEQGDHGEQDLALAGSATSVGTRGRRRAWTRHTATPAPRAACGRFRISGPATKGRAARRRPRRGIDLAARPAGERRRGPGAGGGDGEPAEADRHVDATEATEFHLRIDGSLARPLARHFGRRECAGGQHIVPNRREPRHRGPGG